ncbi:unnamed protein product [Meganyctiphanes norvegica]|uniref:Uncharacterized protein n=1 Tax=Meganyctiphanes norvegica TaxID=48144 RepID=A0AAV2QL99_MEGNR
MTGHSKVHLLLVLVAWVAVIATTAPVVPPYKDYPSGQYDPSLKNISPIDRLNCSNGTPSGGQPPNRVNTTQRVTNLREQMIAYGVQAYIIPTDDAHQSEYVAMADKRREYISGFSGSAGVAVVTETHQALWTDGRYFLQADDQLDCHWLLMRQGQPEVPSIVDWLKEQLEPGAAVGADPHLIGANAWLNYKNHLAESNITMEGVEDNLVDLVWDSDGRPSYSNDSIFIHELQFAGESWIDKISEVRLKMQPSNADYLILTALDEVAWVLNLRGNDVPFNPVFRGYVLIGKDSIELFAPLEKVPDDVKDHLNVNDCTNTCVVLNEYENVLDKLKTISSDSTVHNIMVPGAFSYSQGVSFAIYDSVVAAKRDVHTSPVLLMKASKNPTEVQGMKYAHIKDAVALVEFLAFLEKEITSGNEEWTELKADEKQYEFRALQNDFMGLSFGTISAFGPNGAIIHYEPTEETNTQISTDNLYLLDSGAQYKDGTTDVTRTVHFGTPTPMQIEAYTRVLMGVIDFSRVVFPAGTQVSNVDLIPRRSLYEVGLDYRHGTSHGIGMFLNVHEASSTTYVENWFGSNEPGYYQDGEFGIRIENIMTAVKKETPYNFTAYSIGFESVTLVPFEPKLINEHLLDFAQCGWLNNYNTRVLDIVGNELLNQGREDGYLWLVERTQNYTCGYMEPVSTEKSPFIMTTESSSSINSISLILFAVSIIFVAI